MTLTEIAIKRPSMIIVIFLTLTMAGIFSYQSLKYELLPDFSQPALIVTTAYPGAAPLEVEQSLSIYLEEAISSTENISSIKTQSYEGLSLILVEFQVGTDMRQAEQLVQRNIENNVFKLPRDAKKSSVRRISPSDAPVIQLVASSSKLDESAFFDLVDRQLVPKIQQISGVAQVNVLGQRKREIQINVNRDKLNFYQLSMEDIQLALQSNNLDYPVGKIKNSMTQATVRVQGRVENTEQIKNVQVMGRFARNNVPVRIADIAEVVDALEEPTSVVRLNQKPGIAVIVTRSANANAVNLSAAVRAVMKDMEDTYGESAGLQFSIADDTSTFTLQSASAVLFDLLLAVIIVALIILIFLHSVRDSLIVLISIPASLISTFVAMYVLGYTLNLMTLLAMSLVIGILVDDSIVVLENIHRHLAMKKNKVQAAIDGRKEIGFSAMAITLVDVVVFAPITFVDSVVGDLLRQYSVVVVVSTLMSLFVSFTLTPWLASRFGKITHLNNRKITHKPLIIFEKFFEALNTWYIRRLDWALNHKWISTFAIIASFVATFYIMSLGILGQEMVSPGDRGQFRLSLEFDKNISLYKNNLRTQAIENELLATPTVKTIFSNIGGASTSGGLASLAGISSSNKSEILVTLVDAAQRTQSTENVMIEMLDVLKNHHPYVKIEGVLVGFRGDKPIELVFQSTNKDSLQRAVGLVINKIDDIPGIINPELSVKEGLPELVVNFDRQKMNELQLDVATVGRSLQLAINGNTDIKFLQNDKDYDINLKMDSRDRSSQQDLRQMLVYNRRGQAIPLPNFATIQQNTSPSMLERRNRVPAITIFSDIRGITSGVVAQSINAEMASINIPNNVSVDWYGEIRQQSESFGALGTALLASIVLIYLIMVALYDSFLYPFIVLFSLPVALIGSFLALNIAAASFSIFTMLGLIMLLGLVAKNGILIVDYANRIKERKDITIRQALLKAGSVRLRPIMMTTLAMSFGMLPIALAKGASAEWKNGLGIVMIGGLLSSLMLTVFLVPMVFEVFEKWKVKFTFFENKSKKNVKK